MLTLIQYVLIKSQKELFTSHESIQRWCQFLDIYVCLDEPFVCCINMHEGSSYTITRAYNDTSVFGGKLLKQFGRLVF